MSEYRVQFSQLGPPSTTSQARCGTLRTPHGVIETPIFMPVGTLGTVKALTPRDLNEIGAQIILANTYHLWLRPGIEVLKSQGGLRKWMNWPGPLLTDSGGFQVFSLSEIRKILDEGVEFQSPYDGSKKFMSPEISIEVQEAIGSTIMMVLDVCPALPATPEALRFAIERSTQWAARCLKSRKASSGALFGIVQGGLDLRLRKEHLEQIVEMQVEDAEGRLNSFDGIALGGFSVGEKNEEMQEALMHLVPQMPRRRPRYLMGVGRPEDLLNGIAAGLDMFDCVMPTRNARNGHLFTSHGAVRIKNSSFQHDSRALDERCSCYCCKNFSRSYLRHLHKTDEILAAMLGSLHNLHFYLQLMSESRQAIKEGRFETFRSESLARWREEEEVLGRSS